MNKILENNDLILMEGAVVERLRRCDEVTLHPELVNSLLIYDDVGRVEMVNIYKSYIDIAIKADLPFFMVTPSWRANKERVTKNKISTDINKDLVCFMNEIRDSYPNYKNKIFIGGMISCKNDCYKPEEGLSLKYAKDFHSWQIEKLYSAGVDFIIAETLPSIEEAKGIALALEQFNVPYFVSFVINRKAQLLDKTPISQAIHDIDSLVDKAPLGYMVNCAYPTFLCPENQNKDFFERFVGFLANSSALDHEELDCSKEIKSERVEDWGNAMLELNKKYGVKILGGCCGTGVEHLNYIVNNT